MHDEVSRNRRSLTKILLVAGSRSWVRDNEGDADYCFFEGNTLPWTSCGVPNEMTHVFPDPL
ncbi:MAG TPA: hypothetical protein V6D48_19530 [Oculatellaceae cyanobacterium]